MSITRNIMDVLNLSFSERLPDFFVRYLRETSALQCTIIVHSHSMAHYVRNMLMQISEHFIPQIISLSDYLTLPHECVPHLYKSLKSSQDLTVAQKCWHVSQMLLLAEYCSANWLNDNASMNAEKYLYHLHKSLLHTIHDRDAIMQSLYKICKQNVLLIGSYPQYLLNIIEQWPVHCTYLCREENALMHTNFNKPQVLYHYDEEEQITHVKNFLLHHMKHQSIGILAKKEETIERLRYHMELHGVTMKTLGRENFFHQHNGQTLRFFVNYCAEKNLLNATILLSHVYYNAPCLHNVWKFIGYAQTISQSLSLQEAYDLYQKKVCEKCAEVERLLQINCTMTNVDSVFEYGDIPQNVWKYLQSFNAPSLKEYAEVVENAFFNAETTEEKDSRVCVLGPLEGAWIECDTMLILDASEEVWAYTPSEWSNCLTHEQRTQLDELMRTRLESSLAHAFSAKNVCLFCPASQTAVHPYKNLPQEIHQEYKNTTKYLAQYVAISPRAPHAISLPERLYVSDISMLNANPYAFYLRKILRLFPRQKMFNFGTFMHRILFLCMNRATKEYPQIITQVLKEMGATESDLDLYRFKLSRLINSALSMIHSSSATGEVDGQAEFACAGRVFTLCARADCIVEYEHNDVPALGIVDYKTGTLPTVAEMMSGKSPQMGLEYYIAQKNGFGHCNNVKEMTFVHVHGKDFNDRQGVSRVDLSDPEKISHATMEAVQILLEKYNISDFPAQIQQYYDEYAQLSREKEEAGDDR